MTNTIPPMTLNSYAETPLARRIPVIVLVTNRWTTHSSRDAMFVPLTGRPRLRLARRRPSIGELHAAGALALGQKPAGTTVLRSPRGVTYLVKDQG